MLLLVVGEYLISSVARKHGGHSLQPRAINVNLSSFDEPSVVFESLNYPFDGP